MATNGLLTHQLHKIAKKLRTERDQIIQKKNDVSSFCIDTNELSDVLDEASENIEASKMLRFRNREIFYLKKINKTLDRIERKTYGLCDDCGEPINFERLWARPTAELCIACKEEAEFGEKNNVFHKKSKSLGKALHEMR